MSVIPTIAPPRVGSTVTPTLQQSHSHSHGSPTPQTTQETFDKQPSNSSSSANQDSSGATPVDASSATLGGNSSEGTAQDDEEAGNDDEEADNTPPPVVTLPITPVKTISEDNPDGGETENKPIDDTYDLNFDGSVSDSEASDSPEADLDIADDDDDYDAIDRLSDTSEHSDNIENDAENDIFAEGELGIDWNDEQTYGFDDSWQASQYSLAAELQLGDSLAQDTLLLLDQARRMSASSKPPVEKPMINTYVSSITFPEEWSSSEDEGGSDIEKSVVKEEDAIRRDSQVTSASGQTNTDSLSIDGDDETDEEDIGFRVVSSPGIAIANGSPVTAQSSPFSRRVSPSFPRKTSRKAPVMRKIPVDPKKAICSSVITPQGRVIQFNVPKKSYAIRWIMAGNSRSSSTASCPSKFGFRSTIDHIDSRTGSMIHDVINGRLFQQFHCSPLTTEDHGPSTDIVRNPFLGNSLRPMYLRTPSRRQGGFEELDLDFDEEVPADALNLIDFDGGDIDEDADADTEEVADLERRAHRRHSAPAHSPNLLNQGEKFNVPLLDLDDMAGDVQGDNTMLNIPRPVKKRGYSNSSSTREAMSPLVKKQRLLLEVPAEAVA